MIVPTVNRLLYEYEKWRFAQATTEVLRTPPIKRADGDALIFSQVCARDFLMYLLAAKSFAHHTGLGRFVVLDDGSLSPEHRAILGEHFPGIAINHISQFHSDATPQGGTWERLLLAARLAATDYVVQLDADTLSLGPMPEVAACVAERIPFILVAATDTEAVPQVQPVADAARFARSIVHPHVQIAAEAVLDRIDPSLGTRYVRGCSGFAGYHPAERIILVEEFSRQMRGLLGPRWSEWGTEQVTVNFILANSPGVRLLARPAYGTYGISRLETHTRFVHFQGTYRFKGSRYRRMSLDSINVMANAAGARNRATSQDCSGNQPFTR